MKLVNPNILLITIQINDKQKQLDNKSGVLKLFFKS